MYCMMMFGWSLNPQEFGPKNLKLLGCKKCMKAVSISVNYLLININRWDKNWWQTRMHFKFDWSDKKLLVSCFADENFDTQKYFKSNNHFCFSLLHLYYKLYCMSNSVHRKWFFWFNTPIYFSMFILNNHFIATLYTLALPSMPTMFWENS